MLLKNIKPLIIIFVFVGLISILAVADQFFSQIETQKGIIVSIRDLNSRPVLFHAQPLFFKKVIAVKIANGKEVEIITENLRCGGVGAQVEINKRKSAFLGRITYDNLRDCTKESARKAGRTKISN